MTENATAIRQVLFCPDIFQLICKECTKRTLASLARTKRNLTEPVLNVLWREITDIEPLVNCMPPDLWEEVEGHQVVLRRSIRPTDLGRFYINAARVRKFGFPDDSESDDSESDDFESVDPYANVYVALACAVLGRNEPPFPKLTDIHWAPGDPNVFCYIHLFLSSSIQNAVIGVLDHSDNPYDALPGRLSLTTPLALVCPAIIHFTLTLSADSLPKNSNACEDIKTALSTTKHWPSLSHLTLVYLPSASIYCAAELPYLRELTIEEVHIAPGMDGPLTSTLKGFPVLEILDLQTSRIKFCTSLVNCMSRTPLRSFRLKVRSDPHKEEWRKLFYAIRLGICHNSLQVIDINHDIGEIDNTTENLLTLNQLSPLLVFTSLTKVSITARFDLDNNDLKAIISAWSQIRTLEIISLEHWPQIDLQGLVLIVQHCRLLEFLTMAFDASEVHEYVEKPGRGACNEKVQTLGVLHSPIGDVVKVAVFLSDIFPNLRSISLQEYEDKVPVGFEDLKRKWERVEKLIATFSSVRVQEKTFYTSKSH